MAKPYPKIKEEFNPNIKRALYSNFSNPYEAIQELVDNSVSQRISGKKTKIEILFIKRSGKISIRDYGGRGMSLDNLNFFFKWGERRERSDYDIGLYSQGGKSALGYLGNAFELITSPLGSKEAYMVEDVNLRDTSHLKEYEVMTLPTDKEEGYTSVEISELSFNITDHFKDKLKKILVDTYRPLLESGTIELSIDGSKVDLVSFPLDSDFTVERINRKLSNNRRIKGWIGRLAPRSGIRGGIRCYYKGRLINDREFFSHPDPSYKGTLNFLFGEIYLDFVPVNTNKTGFNKGSEEWQDVEEQMFSILKPHIDELLGRVIEEPTEEDIEKVRKAQDLFQNILKLLDKKEDGVGASSTEDHGQKQPEPRIEDVDENKKNSQERKRGKYQPRTPPPPDKIGVRRRLRRFMNWEPRSMDETIRSKIEEQKGGKVLIINNMFPAYKESKANPFYLLETAALQTVPIEEETLTPQKYLEEFDNFFGKICEHMDKAKVMMDKRKKS